MKRYNLGMTLVELLITLSVGALLMALAVPSYREYVANTHISSTTNLFVAHLNTARTEAITRGEPVSICASADEANCDNATGWDSGWIVFTDSNDGEPGVVDGADQILLIAQAQKQGLSLTSENAYIRFGALGEIGAK